MSWKKGSLKQSTSITARLATFYTLTTLIILFVSSALLYWMLSTSIEHSSESFVRSEITAISNILRGHVGDWSALNQEVVWKPQSQSNHYYARVTLNGLEVRATAGIDDILLSNINWPTAQKKDGAISPSKVIKIDKNQYYLVSTGWVVLDNTAHQAFYIQVALNVSHDQHLLWLYRQNLIFVTIFGTLCAFLVSMFLSKLGLRPVRKLTHALSKINANQLSDRLVIEHPPKELGDLILAFNDSLERLENSFNRLSAFSSDIAHELRTPINNLLGETEVMLSRPREMEEYQHLLSSNLEEYQNLSHIVDRLLFIARADNNNISLTKTPLVLRDEVRAVLDFLEAYAEEKQIRLSIKGNATLEADATLLRNAISNLVTNAIKYIELGGKVSVILEEDEEQVTIKVRDNGLGIKQEHLAHIFDRFYRVDSDRAKHTGGSGLGLAIVKSIIELHGGSITMNSNVGKGSIIIMTFPKLNEQDS